MDRTETIVIGLGVMGAATLDALAGAGRAAIGVDRFEPPHAMGSSHGRSRVIRTAYFEDPAYVPMLRDAWRAWQALERAPGELLVPTGTLNVGPEAHACIVGVRRAARDHDLAIEELDARAIRARFPAMSPGDDDVAVLERQGGVLFAERCVAALIARARERGATVRTSERVIAIEVGDRRVVVRTDRTTYEAERVVLAQGAWSEGDASVLPFPVSLRVERQVQLWMEPKVPAHVRADRLPVFIWFTADGAFYGLPDVAPPGEERPGIKVCEHHGPPSGRGEGTRADALDRAVRASDETRVRTFVRSHLPAADGPLRDARVCMYTNTPDDHFVVGPHPSHPAVLLACGFSGHGFKLAPAIGAALADHVVRGAALPPLFDPRREAVAIR